VRDQATALCNQGMLTRYVTTDRRIVVAPGAGKDTAVLDLGDRYLVAADNAITSATEEIRTPIT